MSFGRSLSGITEFILLQTHVTYYMIYNLKKFADNLYFEVKSFWAFIKLLWLGLLLI